MLGCWCDNWRLPEIWLQPYPGSAKAAPICRASRNLGSFLIDIWSVRYGNYFQEGQYLLGYVSTFSRRIAGNGECEFTAAATSSQAVPRKHLTRYTSIVMTAQLRGPSLTANAAK